MASYKGVDIAGLQSLISSYRTAIENSNDDEAIANLSNEQILKSNNNAKFNDKIKNIMVNTNKAFVSISVCPNILSKPLASYTISE